jgi:hypothetical protein
LIEIRDSKIIGFYNYEIENKLEENDEEILKSFVEQCHFEFLADKFNNDKITYILPFEINFE